MMMEKKQRALEIVVKIVVAALTAFLTAGNNQLHAMHDVTVIG